MDRASIINSMLSVVGESGISSSMSSHPSVQTASRILDTQDLDFQQVGWWFNRESALVLLQDENGRVPVPNDALDVQVYCNDRRTNPADKARFTRRGDFMYDAVKHTDIISASVTVNVIVQLAINSLPSIAASYLLHKAREQMFIDDDGDNFKTQTLQQATAEAWQKLKAKELAHLAVNAMDNPVSRLLRSGMGQSSGRSSALLGAR